MELNPREVLFEQILDALAVNGNYEQCIWKVKSIKNFMDSNLTNTEILIASEIKKLFGASEDESLTTCLRDWYANQSNKAKTHIFNDTVTTFMSYVGEINTFDEQEIAEKISKLAYGIYISDWKDVSKNEFIESLRSIKNQIESIEEIGDKVSNRLSGENRISFTDSNGNTVEKYYEADEEDSTSYFLKNAIEDALEEFGDSLEMNQKLSVLVKAIEEPIK